MEYVIVINFRGIDGTTLIVILPISITIILHDNKKLEKSIASTDVRKFVPKN